MGAPQVKWMKTTKMIETLRRGYLKRVFTDRGGGAECWVAVVLAGAIFASFS
jgi:hypothetical protein